MRGIGNDHAAPLGGLAALRVIGLEHQKSGELGVRPGRGLERRGVHSGELCEELLQLEHQPERALNRVVVLAGVDLREAGQRRDPVVDLRVVLHRA